MPTGSPELLMHVLSEPVVVGVLLDVFSDQSKNPKNSKGKNLRRRFVNKRPNTN